MMLLDPIKTFINKTDIKTFFHYTLGYLGVCVLCSSIIIFYYYRSTNALQKKIRDINSYREETLEILEKSSLVQQQRAMVEEVLTKDPDFKIVGTFEAILKELNLTGKQEGSVEITPTDLEENYRKNELHAKLQGMTMQELTELLQKIEKNPRIATEQLTITKSKKKPKTIEVSITISTLLPKIENTSI